MIVFIIVVSAMVIAIVLAIVISKLKQRIACQQEQFVLENSTKIRDLKMINSQYHFNNPKNRSLVYDIFLNSKKSFDNFDWASAIQNTFFEKRVPIKTLMDKITRDKLLLSNYIAEIKKIKETDYDSLPKIKHMSKKIFLDLENEYFMENIKNIPTNISLKIRWSYTTPAGRNYYENYRIFDYNAICKLFLCYFNEDLRNVVNNEKLEKAISLVSMELINKVYKTDDVRTMFEKYDVHPTEQMISSILYKCGFLKRKDSNFYVHSSIKDTSDFILFSSSNDGLITYNNIFKDKEYDDAIEKLENNGRIIPIDNLHFLKVSKTLNYKGITSEIIDKFQTDLLKFAKKELFISVKLIKENIHCLITEADFDDCFVYSIAKHSGYLWEVQGIPGLLCLWEKTPRIFFLEHLLKNKKSLDAYDLIFDLKQIYDIDYSINAMQYDIAKSNTKIYYNSETEKLYSKKDYFFEELEDVL